MEEQCEQPEGQRLPTACREALALHLHSHLGASAACRSFRGDLETKTTCALVDNTCLLMLAGILLDST